MLKKNNKLKTPEYTALVIFELIVCIRTIINAMVSCLPRICNNNIHSGLLDLKKKLIDCKSCFGIAVRHDISIHACLDNVMSNLRVFCSSCDRHKSKTLITPRTVKALTTVS